MSQPLSSFTGRRQLLQAALGATTLSLFGCGGGGDDLADNVASDVAKQLVRGGFSPGVATIAFNNQAFRVGVAGLRRADGAQIVTMLDRFSIGSMTKAVTATLVAQQVQSRHVQWNARLYEAWPELAQMGLPDYTDVTLRDLLTHHAGLPALDSLESLGALPPLSGSLSEQRWQLLRWAVTVPRTPADGSFNYSNGGYVAAAAWIERLRALDYETLVQRELFGRLQITPPFASPAARADRSQPWPHVWDAAANRWQTIDPSTAEIAIPGFGNPAGGLAMRLMELLAFCQMHLRAMRGESGQLLRPETAREMHTEIRDLQGQGWVITADLKSRPISFTAGSDEYSFYAMIGISADRNRGAAVLSCGYRDDTVEALAGALTQLLD